MEVDIAGCPLSAAHAHSRSPGMCMWYARSHPGHVGHTTCTEILLGNTHTTWEHRIYVDTRAYTFKHTYSHLTYLAYCSPPRLKSSPLFPKSELAFVLYAKKKLRPSLFMVDTITFLPAFDNLLLALGLAERRVGEIWHKEMLRRHLVVRSHNCSSVLPLCWPLN